MVIKVETKIGNIYFTNAIELINNGLDMRLTDLNDDKQDGDYVLIDCHQVREITLREY